MEKGVGGWVRGRKEGLGEGARAGGTPGMLTSSNLGLDSFRSAVAVEVLKYFLATSHTLASISHMTT